MDDVYIKLPMLFGLEISKILSNRYDIESRKNNFGMLSLEFTSNELSYIEELTFTNPARNSLDGIEYLPNLKKLTINTLINKGYRQNRAIASISSADIANISKIPSLEELEIINQNGIHHIDVGNLSNLKSLKISENANLDEISGLNSLTKLTDIEIYENKNLLKIDGLNEVIKTNKLNKLILGLIYFRDSVNYNHDTCNMDIDSLNVMGNIKDMSFIEIPSDLKPIMISPNEALKFHQKCISILDNRFSSKEELSYIVGIEEYLTRNVTYDYEALKHDNTHLSEANIVGPINGSNGAYNAIMYNTCTCEGYPRAMIYLLKQVNINAHMIHCNKEKHINMIDNPYDVLPDDGFHSVLSIDDFYNLYCDPCWDASKYNSGDTNYLPFTLLSKDEISRTHTLMFEERSTGNESLNVPRYVIEAYLKSNQKHF